MEAVVTIKVTVSELDVLRSALAWQAEELKAKVRGLPASAEKTKMIQAEAQARMLARALNN